ncbi:MAG: leucine-rich repeat domain-containing protein [Planctomycetales bacterium]
MDKKRPFWTPWPITTPKSMRHGITEVAEYRRTKNLVLNCTQLSGPASRQRRIVDEWIEFLRRPSPIRTLLVVTRCPERLFEALCNQHPLTALGIKWGPIQDLSPISQLKELERLDLGSCSIEDLSPLSALTKLEHLSLENLDRLSDYSALGKLKKLLYLRIEGAVFMPKKVWIDDLQFLRSLRNLRGLSIAAARFRDPGWAASFEGLDHLEYLDLPRTDEEDREQLLKSLPNLRHGNVANPRQ